MKKNPITVVGRLDQCFLFMYSCPVEMVRNYIPSIFEIVTYRGQAIIGVVVSDLKQMRPSYFPKWTGVSYSHIAYRVYVRYTPPGKRTLQGLYFLRSDANSAFMKWSGNLLTNYQFHRANIYIHRTPDQFTVRVNHSDDGMGNAEAVLELAELNKLASDSLFPTLDEAKRVLHYEPYAFALDESRRVINVVKVTRDESKWVETPVVQQQAKFDYLVHLLGNALHHELTLCVNSIEYRWDKAVEYPL